MQDDFMDRLDDQFISAKISLVVGPNCSSSA